MDEIKCLSCGETLNIPQVINTSKYDGELVCQECKSRLHVRLVEDKLERYYIVNAGTFNIDKALIDASRKFEEAIESRAKRQEEEVYELTEGESKEPPESIEPG